MTIMTTPRLVLWIVAIGASVLAATLPIHAASEQPRIFERSIHGSYDIKPAALTTHDTTVTAKASAAGLGGYWVRRFRARSRALAKWRIEAAKASGPGATRWTLARHKRVTCSARPPQVHCTVSAAPKTVLQRLGLVSRYHR